MANFVNQVEIIVGKLSCHLQPADGFRTTCNVYSLYDVNVLPPFPTASDMGLELLAIKIFLLSFCKLICIL